MPYVTQERRPALDEVIHELIKAELDVGDMEEFLFHLALNVRALWHTTHLDKALEKSRSVGIKPNGDINYILFKYCKYHIRPSYNNYKTFMGEIHVAMNRVHPKGRKFIDEYREAAEWIRIKVLAPYEEKAIEKNGDV